MRELLAEVPNWTARTSGRARVALLGLMGTVGMMATTYGLGAGLAQVCGAQAASAGAATEFKEDFDGVPDGQLPQGWKPIEGSWAVAKGALRGSAPAGVNGRIRIGLGDGDALWRNFVFEATLAFESAVEPTRWAALIYRMGENGQPPYHLFTVRKNTAATNGMELAFRQGGGNWDVRKTASWERPFAFGEPHRLRIMAYEDEFLYFVDDRLVLSGTYQTYRQTGFFGLHVNGTTVLFDDLVIKPLSGEEFSKVKASIQQQLLNSAARPRRPLVIAHRGLSSQAPENSLAALRLALGLGQGQKSESDASPGVDLVENDVWMSKDGHLVVIHDERVDRTTNGKGPITGMTLAEIKQLRLKGGSGAETIPTLEEFLAEAAGRVVTLIEIKQEGIGAAVADFIRQGGYERQVVIQSFSAGNIRSFKQVLPQVPAMLLIGEVPGGVEREEAAAWVVAQALQAGANGVALGYGLVTQDLVQYVQRRGLSVWVWTVDVPDQMERLAEMGVNGIITNYPDRLLAL